MSCDELLSRSSLGRISQLSFSSEPSLPQSTMLFPFLRLPAELRNIIYKHLLIYPDPNTQDTYHGLPDTIPSHFTAPILTTSLLLANRQIHTEAAFILYSSNTWTLRCSNHFAHFLPGIGPRNARNIRRLIIDGGEPWDWGSRYFFKQLGWGNKLLLSREEQRELVPKLAKQWWETAAAELSAVIKLVARLCCDLELFDVRFYGLGMETMVPFLGRTGIFLGRTDIRQALQAVKCVRGTLALCENGDWALCEEVARAMGGVEKLVVTWPAVSRCNQNWKKGEERKIRCRAEGWDVLELAEEYKVEATKVLGLPAVENWEIEMSEAPADIGEIRLAQVESLDGATGRSSSWRCILCFDYWYAAMGWHMGRSKTARRGRWSALKGKLIKRDL